jgi:hypothetical protein
MLTSLTTASTHFKTAINTIPLAVKSTKGSQLVYIIVEDVSDMLIFRKFFNHTSTQIFISCISENENAKRSCVYVENIVSTISTTSNALIIGIRDADYTIFDTTYTLPDNVFRTDARDIEMMMFECDDVKHEFTTKFDFELYYNKTITIARKIGYYRIFNDIHKLGFSFKKQLKFSDLLDNKTGDLKAESINLFSDLFFANSTIHTKDEFDTHIQNVEHAPNTTICRGHDVVTILANYLKNKYTKVEIELTLAVYYSYQSFKKSILYRDIENWGNAKGKQLFI